MTSSGQWQEEHLQPGAELPDWLYLVPDANGPLATIPPFISRFQQEAVYLSSRSRAT